MTIDKSLKIRRGLGRARSVLTRDERLAKLMETDRWKEGDSVLGMPKVRVMKIALKKKKAKKAEGEGDAAAAPAAGGDKKAAAAKPAAAKPAAKAGGDAKKK